MSDEYVRDLLQSAGQAAGVGGGGHAGDASAFASSQVHSGAATHSGGDAGGGIWEQMVDRIQILSNTWGMTYDTDTTLGDKASRVLLPVFLACRVQM